MALRLVLLAAAGVASLAYLALRPKTTPELSREVDLASLERHLDNWLPKLPFVPFIRIGTPDTGYLKITGDDTTVRMHLLPIADPGIERLFRHTCRELALQVHEARVNNRIPDLYCEMRSHTTTVAPALDTLLRDVFDVHDRSRLVAIVPGDS